MARVRDVRDLPRGIRLAIADVLDDERVGNGVGSDDAYGQELEALMESLGLDE